MGNYFQDIDKKWTEIGIQLDKMFSSLHGALDENDIAHFKRNLNHAKNEVSLTNCIQSLIKLVERLSSSIKMENNSKGIVKNLDEPKVAKKSLHNEKLKIPAKQHSNFNCLSDNMVKKVCKSLPNQRYFFWKYGAVCKAMLFHVTNFLLRQNFLVAFEPEGEKFKQNLTLLNTSSYISKAIAKLGAAITFNKSLDKDDMLIFATKCYNLRFLQLFQSNVPLPHVEVITTKLKKLSHLNVGSCRYIHKEMIDMVSKNCKYLETLQTPFCTTLSFVNPNSGQNVSFIFGVAIDDYEVFHNRANCKVSQAHIYKIGSYLGGTKTDRGELLHSLIKVICKR